MQCTAAALPRTMPAGVPRTISPRSLAAAFARVPDPRRTTSTTYALPALLTLAVAAILCNHLSVLAIAKWGARQSPDMLRALGFTAGRTPCQSTLHRLFRKLDGHALARALSAHVAPALQPVAAHDAAPQERGLCGVAVDGKAQRGRLPFQDGGCPVHALTAFCHEQGLVLAHEPIAPGQGTAKGEAELTVAPALLARVSWPGRVLTGDALFCQRHLCQQVLDAGGDYLLLVKENQRTLYDAIRLLFDPPPDLAPPPLLDRREMCTVERGHGRRADTRCLVASTDLTEYLDWPGLAGLLLDAHLAGTWHDQAGGALWPHQSGARGRATAALTGPQTRALGHRKPPASRQGCGLGRGCEPGPLWSRTGRHGVAARGGTQPAAPRWCTPLQCPLTLPFPTSNGRSCPAPRSSSS